MQVIPVNHEHVRWVYARINDLELRHSPVEKDKLRELERLTFELLTTGRSLTEQEIEVYKLEKYKGG